MKTWSYKEQLNLPSLSDMCILANYLNNKGHLNIHALLFKS